MYKGRVLTIPLEDFYDSILVRIGQHLARSNITNTEFPYSEFKTLFKHKIFPFYKKYFYKTDFVRTYVTFASPFTFDSPAPEIISNVVPISIYGLYLGEFFNFRFITHTSYLSTKPLSRFMIAWRYEKPKLYVGYQGQVEITAHWSLTFDEANNTVEIDPETEDLLHDLCTGHVLSALGRSRRMIRIGDANLEFDAEAMVTEGEELIERSRERIIQLADLSVNVF